MPTLQITPKGASSPVSVQADDSFLKLSPDQQNQTVDEIASSLPKARGDAQGNIAWPVNVPTPGSAADAAADAALMSQGGPQGGGAGAIPPLPPGFTLDQPQQSSVIPPLPPGFTLDTPGHASRANANAPWTKDPIVVPAGSTSGGQSVIPPLPPGFTLDQQPAGPKDTSYGSALQQGLHDAASGLGSTLGVLSGDVGFQAGQTAGSYLQNAIPAPVNYQSAGGDIVSKLKAGQLLGALKDLPRAAVEGAPAVLGGLGAAAATPEVLGGAAVGAGAYGALSAFGQDAQARAAANGHAQPTAGDQLAAAPTALAQGGLNAVGLGKVPGVSALLMRSPAVLRGLAAGGVDAAGQAASNVVGQVGTTAGTKQGLQVDPDQAAAAALQALAARAGGKIAMQTLGATGSGVTSAVRSIGMGLAASDLPKMSDEQAASYARINAAYDAQAPAR